MCLSNVYFREKQPESLVIEEAHEVTADGKSVHIRSLMGQTRDVPGYYISEVNFIENYMILKKQPGA